MAKGRMISKSASTSKKLSLVQLDALVLFLLIVAHTDEYGRLEAEPEMIKAKVVPLRKDITVERIIEIITELRAVGLIKTYTVGEDHYLEVVNFDDHQTFRNDRKRKQEYPVPTKYDEVTSGIPTGDNETVRDTKKLSKAKLSKAKPRVAEAPMLLPIGDEETPSKITGKSAKPKKPVTKLPGTVINEALELFKEINPDYSELYRNNTERKALDYLLGKYGLEKVQATIAFIKNHAGKGSPNITTPLEMKNKLAGLIQWANKQGLSTTTKVGQL